MKKIGFVVVLLCAFVLCAFGQSYTVQNVSGRVEREAGGQRVAVNAGETLSADTVIFTSIGASLVLKQGDKVSTVSSARSGKVADLVAASSGIRIGGNVVRTETAAVNRTTSQVSTASARASDAAKDEDVAAE